MYSLRRFGDLTIPPYNPEFSENSGGSLDPVVITSGGVTFDLLGSEQAPREATTIQHRGTILGEGADGNAQKADARSQYLAWRAMRGKRAKLYRWIVEDDETGDGRWEWVYARLMGFNADRQYGQFTWLEVDFSWRLISTTWNGTRHGGGWALDAGESLDEGLGLDEDETYTITGSQVSLGIVNNGNETVKNAILRIVGGSSPLSSVRINTTLFDGDVDFTYTGIIDTGEELVIDTGSFSVTLDGADAYSGFSFTTGHEIQDWFPLEPLGTSVNVSVIGGGSDSTITFQFYDGWA